MSVVVKKKKEKITISVMTIKNQNANRVEPRAYEMALLQPSNLDLHIFCRQSFLTFYYSTVAGVVLCGDHKKSPCTSS